VNGGSIAWAPIGCTGTRITITLLHEMQRRKAKLVWHTLRQRGWDGAGAGERGKF